jgi:hypothetical protein
MGQILTMLASVDNNARRTPFQKLSASNIFQVRGIQPPDLSAKVPPQYLAGVRATAHNMSAQRGVGSGDVIDHCVSGFQH